MYTFFHIMYWWYMKTLGILGKDMDESYVFNKKYLRKLSSVNCIGLFPGSDLSICDGFFIQGGKDIDPWFYDVIKYAINNKKPILGICLGCQTLGTYGSGSLKNVTGHLDTNHDIYIKANTFLHDLFGPVINVNSSHKEAIDELSSDFEVLAVSDDGVIEAIKYKYSDTFIVGVQWHPELMESMDVLFDKFLSEL